MAYNTSSANHKPLGPTQRVKTGDFQDAFAREGNRRRNEARTGGAPFINHRDDGEKPNHMRNLFSWLPQMRRPAEDEERLRNGPQLPLDSTPDLLIHCMRIPIAWSRVPNGGEKETLFLATENSKSDIPGPEGRSLHWIHMQHYGGIDFDTFKSRAFNAIDIPVNAKTLIRDWMSDVYPLEAQKIFGGKALDTCFKKQRLSSLSGQNFLCIFFAIPYLLLSERCRYAVDKDANTDFHPIRALVQSAYRTDSLFTREKSQAVRKVLDLEGNTLVYVPQLWGLIIGDYLVTCASSQLHTHRESSIIPLPLEDTPPAIRLRHADGSRYYVDVMECPTWFDFLIRIHHIYSHLLLRHVDAEKCMFYDVETNEALNADSWPSILYRVRECHTCITLIVLLDKYDTISHATDYANEAYFTEPDSDRRTWSRVSKKFMEVETLNAFNLPWEEDKKDPSYIIIKTYTDEDFLEVLFEHTRRSRRMREEAEVRELSDEEAGDHEPVTDDRKRDQKGSPWHWPGCIGKDPAHELRRAEGGMFWSADSPLLHGVEVEGEGHDNYKPTEDYTNDPTRPAGHSTDSHTKSLILPYLSWPQAANMPVLSRSQGPKTVTRVPESRRAFDSNKDRHPYSLPPELLLYRILQKERAFASLPRAKKAQLDELKTTFFQKFPVLPAEEAFSMLSDYPEIDLCELLCELVDHFLPDGMECLLKDKIYGGLHIILKECLEAFPGTKPSKFPLLKFLVELSLRLLALSRNIRSGIQTDTSRLPLLTAHMDCFRELCLAISHLSCFIREALSRERRYIETHPEQTQTAPDILDDSISEIPTAPSPKEEHPVTRTPSDNSMMARFTTGDQRTQDIPSQSEGTTENFVDGIPSSSHRSSSSAASLLSDDSIEYASLLGGWKTGAQARSRDDAKSDDMTAEIEEGPIMEALFSFRKVEDLLMESKYSIICTLVETNPLVLEDYTAVGPARIVSSIIEHVALGLTDMCDLEPFRLEDIYREYSSQLRIKVRDKPSRTLLDELDLLEEELDSIGTIIEKQKGVIMDFMNFVDDNISGTKRGSKEVLQNCIRELNDKAALYSEMNLGIEKLRRRVVRQVDLQQDNNSKAILVFTTVTTVFLPMSFMTSYLGMNTSDIRDMDSNQWLFWAISAPFTLFVVGVCMVIAYEGARIRDAIVDTVTKRRMGKKRLRGVS